MQTRFQRPLPATLPLVAPVQLALGAVTLAQVFTAYFLPLMFITMLWSGMPKADPASQLGA